MRNHLRVAWCLALALLFVGERAARAGITNENIDLLYVTPFLGGEVATVGFGGVTATGQVVGGDFSIGGFTFGGVAGVRLGPIGLGLLVQRTTDSPNGVDLSLNKLYGQLAFNSPLWKFVL